MTPTIDIEMVTLVIQPSVGLSCLCSEACTSYLAKTMHCLLQTVCMNQES